MEKNKMTNINVRCIDCHIVNIQNQTPNYLLLKRSKNKVYPNIWQCVTGKINLNETPIEAALREVNEETKLSPISLWSIDYVNQYYDPNNNSMNLIPVFGMLVDQTKITLSEEHQEYKWLNFNDAKNKLLWTNQKKGLEYFQEIILNPELEKSNILKIL
tara:strand:- start:114 stop:590 length:477 start_codon:yes stop_codon:yes gene_type:complete